MILPDKSKTRLRILAVVLGGANDKMNPVGIGHSLKLKDGGAAGVWNLNEIGVVDKRPHDVDEGCCCCDLAQKPKVATRSRWGRSAEVAPRETDARGLNIDLDAVAGPSLS